MKRKGSKWREQGRIDRGLSRLNITENYVYLCIMYIYVYKKEFCLSYSSSERRWYRI